MKPPWRCIYLFFAAWQYELNVMEEDFSAKRPDLGAIEEYKRKESVYLERVSELDQITAKKEQQRKRHEDLRYSLFKGYLVLINSFLQL